MSGLSTTRYPRVHLEPERTFAIIVGPPIMYKFVIRELRAETPVVNLKVFKNVSFATGTVILFFVFFGMFSPSNVLYLSK
jgi:NAD(P)H-flavin reductase